ncbi:MAG: hypothetical protein HWE26_18880 [Alteromonadaceae bacterium]|nr:hypothetical protein [Alteromonadaceae bacterium]
MKTLFIMNIRSPGFLRIVLAGIIVAIPSLSQATTAPEMQPEISQCPEQFHNVTIHKAAKLCQPFDVELPASLIYFVAVSPEAMINYYLTLMPELSRQSEHNQRVLLLDNTQNIRVVVSPDDNGAQVDILVLANHRLTSGTSE